MNIIVANLQDNPAVLRIFIALLRFSFQSSSYVCEIFNIINKTALTYLCNLAGTDYKLPEDDPFSVETCGSSIMMSIVINFN